ncbi:MAG: aminotransferase class V-fold PLP-dependent enzyme [Acidimicrobiales bacterium]|nr:aminotransferase class V-fold PLP-dependent enzyme [Acidimicrobiales bacterium]
MPQAYLDHAASTPLRPEARAALDDALGLVGNPSGQHRWAREARRRLDDARDQVAEVLGVTPGSVVFTSGGTEADNLAVTGVVAATGGVPLCTAVEHHAVLDPVHAAGGTTIEVDAAGVVDLVALEATLRARPEVALVAVMAANNEVGTCQPLDAVAEVVAAARPGRPHGLVLHSDAVAAAAWTDLAAVARAADLVALSGHKVGGPKGIGVLAVRPGVALAPLVRGGGQERE